MAQDQCVKGINWGEIAVDDKQLTLKHNKASLLRIPVKKIMNSNTQKNDIVLQLNTDELDPKQKFKLISYISDDMLCEVRFYIPPSQTDVIIKQKHERKKEQEEAQGQEEKVSGEEQDDGKQTFQQSLQNDILTKAKIGQSTADSLASIHDVPLIVPRGKYNMDFFRNSIRFHGSTYQFTTEYKSISKLFMLPMPDEINMAIVIGLDKPLKQGQTTYNFMVMQFRKDTMGQVVLKYTKEKLIEYGWLTIQQEYNGPLFDVVCQLLTEITGVRVVIPKHFKSKNGGQCLRCSVGPHQGHLFPLEKSMLYISKPVAYIKHEDIKEVIFQRISQSNLNKLFDVKIVSRGSTQLFAGLERGELDNLSDYFGSRKIKVQRIQEDVHQKISLNESEGEDEDDEDDSRKHEQRGKQRTQVTKQNVNNNFDSDEDDEDFEVNPNQVEPSDSDISDGSESNVEQKKVKK